MRPYGVAVEVDARNKSGHDEGGRLALPRAARVPMPRAMIGAIAFDTHRFVKRLTEGGFTEEQAETLAEEQVALLNTNLATKADIEAVRADVEVVNADLQRDIEAVKADLLKWLFGAMIAQAGLIVALVKLL